MGSVRVRLPENVPTPPGGIVPSTIAVAVYGNLIPNTKIPPQKLLDPWYQPRGSSSGRSLTGVRAFRTYLFSSNTIPNIEPSGLAKPLVTVGPPSASQVPPPSAFSIV